MSAKSKGTRTTVLAIDPGTTESAFVVWDGERVGEMGIVPNNRLRDTLDFWCIDHSEDGPDWCAIEMVEHYGTGMPAGREVFETCVWIGRFQEVFAGGNDVVTLLPRRKVKMHLCGSMRAKDANVRQALIDRFGPPGTKKNPGELYGVKSHLWAALAVAVTWMDQRHETST